MVPFRFVGNTLAPHTVCPPCPPFIRPAFSFLLCIMFAGRVRRCPAEGGSEPTHSRRCRAWGRCCLEAAEWLDLVSFFVETQE